MFKMESAHASKITDTLANFMLVYETVRVPPVVLKRLINSLCGKQLRLAI